MSNASSNVRDCAFERYRIAQSLRRPPFMTHSRMRLTTKSASSRSLNAAYSSHRLALLAAGPQVLAEPAGVVADERVGGGEDVAGRAIVLLEAEHLHARESRGGYCCRFSTRAPRQR